MGNANSMARLLAMAVQRGRQRARLEMTLGRSIYQACGCVGWSLLVSCVLLGGEPDGSRGWRLGFLMPAQPAEAAALRRGVEAGIASARKMGVAVDWIGRSRTGQWGVEGEESARLALDDLADGLMAPPAGASTHLVLQVAGRTAVPVVSMCADSSVTGAGVPWLLQITPDTEAQAQALWGAFKQGDATGPKKWMAVVPAGRAGREVRKDLEKAARKCGVLLDPVWSMAAVDSGATEKTKEGARTQEQQASEISPTGLPVRAPASTDGLMVWLEAPMASEVVKAWRRAGRRERLAGPARLCSREFRQRAGDLSAQVFVAVPESAVLARSQSGGSASADVEGRLDWDEHMALESVLVLVERLKLGDGGNEAMRLPGKEWAGVDGAIRFDQWGKRQTELRVTTAAGTLPGGE